MQPDPQRVGLGSSGRTVQVSKLENGTYQLAGGPLWTGEVRDTGGGATYRFSLGSDGLWSATYVAEPTTVHLGAHGGTIRVVRQESGLWTLGERTIRSGYEVERVQRPQVSADPGGRHLAGRPATALDPSHPARHRWQHLPDAGLRTAPTTTRAPA